MTNTVDKLQNDIHVRIVCSALINPYVYPYEKKLCITTQYNIPKS